MELKYYTILTSPQYNNPSLLVNDWNKENYPFGFGGVNHDGTECIWAEEQKVYLKKDVDESIAELKQKLDKAIAERDGNQVCIDALKEKLENVQASMYADVVDANMEVRRLKRALYIVLARSFCCMRELAARNALYDDECKWDNFKTTCLKKAEEYK